MDWFDAIERLGLSGALLLLIVLTVRYYLGPWFQSFITAHNELVHKLKEAIDKQDETNDKQTEILESIVKEEHEEKALLHEIKDGITRIETTIQRSSKEDK